MGWANGGSPLPRLQGSGWAVAEVRGRARRELACAAGPGRRSFQVQGPYSVDRLDAEPVVAAAALRRQRRALLDLAGTKAAEPRRPGAGGQPAPALAGLAGDLRPSDGAGGDLRRRRLRGHLLPGCRLEVPPLTVVTGHGPEPEQRRLGERVEVRDLAEYEEAWG